MSLLDFAEMRVICGESGGRLRSLDEEVFIRGGGRLIGSIKFVIQIDTLFHALNIYL